VKKKTVTVALLCAFIMTPIGVIAQQHDPEHLIIEMANTPAEHRAVARHYKLKADEAREEARRHEAMGRLYATGRSARPGGREHCENIAAKLEEVAAEYEALADLHEEQSKAAE
jgi:hypothetical protein